MKQVASYVAFVDGTDTHAGRALWRHQVAVRTWALSPPVAPERQRHDVFDLRNVPRND